MIAEMKALTTSFTHYMYVRRLANDRGSIRYAPNFNGMAPSPPKGRYLAYGQDTREETTWQRIKFQLSKLKEKV